ncbi:MAG TPA: Clp1/GlmU family protein, partial [Candidatus Hodarchaeales archaeon]|nr:Clp1/GlmU family protein [Candidatus Hodarchaeales archaeon]
MSKTQVIVLEETTAELEARKWFVCRGLSSEGFAELTKGQIELFTIPIKKNPSRFDLIVGQSLIGQSITPISLRLQNAQFQPLQSAPFPSTWSNVYLSLTAYGAVPVSQRVEVIGAPDQGKTTALLYLGHKLKRKAKSVGWLDLDPGQNTLCWPGTLAYGEFGSIEESSSNWLPIAKKYLMFGSTTPRGLLKSYRDVLQELIMFAEEQRPDWLLIDTPGYVGDEYAREIHQTILNTVRPQNLVQLGDEDFQLWCRLLGFRFKRFVVYPTSKVGASVQNRTQETRRQRREVKYSHLLSELSTKLILKDSQVNNVLLPTSGGWIPHTDIRGFTWSPHQL